MKLKGEDTSRMKEPLNTNEAYNDITGYNDCSIINAPFVIRIISLNKTKEETNRI